MPRTPFRDAAWISRAVPADARISREIRRDRIDWVEAGHSLAQTVTIGGTIYAVAADIAGPREDPFGADVRFVLSLETASGENVAERVVDGPQLGWERFGQLLDVAPGACAGEYTLVLRVERGTIGWYSADTAEGAPDDGTSPVPIRGTALADGAPVSGVRNMVVDTEPAANPWFRGTFEVDGDVRSATLASVVLGCGNVRVNGHLVGEAGLGPAVTAYDKTVLYRTDPVAHLLRPGINEILIEAGRERYSARGGDIWGWNAAPWHREPSALVALRIEHEDGRETMFVTGEDWQAAAGPVERDTLFGGETWALPHMPSWAAVAVVTGPMGRLRPAPGHGVRALAPIPPASSAREGDRTTVDFGSVMTGRVRLTVTGTAGDVVVRSGEHLEDGRVVCNNVLVAGEAQIDRLRVTGSLSSEIWEPQFGYRGFRWMDIEATGDLRIDEIRAVPLYTHVDVVGSLTSDNPALEWIDTVTARTFRNNLHGIPTDTPVYEKNGWTADAHLATEALLHHFDVREAFTKWLDDHVDAQTADGAIPQIVPTPGWGVDADPAWSGSAVFIPWYMYVEYGDLDLLRRYRDMIVRFADRILSLIGEGVWRHRTWGDWLAPGYEFAPEGMAPIGTIMAAEVAQKTADVLEALGESGEHYRVAATGIASRYHRSYFDEASGDYRVEGIGYRQSLNVLPLAFGLVPDEHIESVRAGLIADIEHRTDGHLDCGAIAVRHLLGVLSDAGRDDLALTVLLTPTRPGWGYWYADGENTLLESWDETARSRNHYFLGSVASWIQQRVGGLRVTAPGWAAFDINPVRDARVTRGSMSHDTVRGTVAVEWERGEGGWRFVVTVPGGASATIAVGREPIALGEGRHELFVT